MMASLASTVLGCGPTPCTVFRRRLALAYRFVESPCCGYVSRRHLTSASGAAPAGTPPWLSGAKPGQTPGRVSQSAPKQSTSLSRHDSSPLGGSSRAVQQQVDKSASPSLSSSPRSKEQEHLRKGLRRVAGAIEGERQDYAMRSFRSLLERWRDFPWKSCVVFMIFWSWLGMYAVPWIKEIQADYAKSGEKRAKRMEAKIVARRELALARRGRSDYDPAAESASRDEEEGRRGT